MDDAIRTAIHHSQVIDLTTTGRRTGQQRRIEIFLHDDHGRLFITGMPRADRTRDWIYNIAADPSVVVHLRQSVVADIPATARVITDPDERLPLIEAAAKRWVAPTSQTCSSTARSLCSASMETPRSMSSTRCIVRRHQTSDSSLAAPSPSTMTPCAEGQSCQRAGASRRRQ